jgi:hypothetical protein
VNGSVHIDMSSGCVHFFAAQNEGLEIHTADALVRPATTQPTQGAVALLAPKVLEVRAEKGSLNFQFHEEFRNLPEGQTYRIYRDSPASPEDATGDSTPRAGRSGKVIYFIVGAGVAGGTAWVLRKRSAGETRRSVPQDREQFSDYVCAFVKDFSCSSFSSAVPDANAREAIAAPSRRSFAIPDTNRAAAAFIMTTSRRAPSSPSKSLRIDAAFSSGEPPCKALSGAVVSPKSWGVSTKCFIRPSRTSATCVSPESDISSRPPAP